MKAVILRLIGTRTGASSIEYAIILALMAIALIVSVAAVGSPTQQHFEAAGNSYPAELQQPSS